MAYQAFMFSMYAGLVEVLALYLHYILFIVLLGLLLFGFLH